jgi:hypothetical protein
MPKERNVSFLQKCTYCSNLYNPYHTLLIILPKERHDLKYKHVENDPLNIHHQVSKDKSKKASSIYIYEAVPLPGCT